MDSPGRAALRAFLGQVTTVTDDAWAALQTGLADEHLPRRSHFVRGGEPVRHAAFVTRGLLESYRLDENGKEAIVRFCPEGTLAAPYADLLMRRAASTAFIRALEDSAIVRIDYARWLQVMEMFPSLERAGRVIAEREFVERECHEVELMTASALERLSWFRGRYPALLRRVPQNRLAAYLGLNPVTVSRLLARLPPPADR